MEINLKPILGNWAHGWALAQHTVRSTADGPNSNTHPEFDTERTELGEALYKLKYRADHTQLEPLARTIADFIRGRSELEILKHSGRAAFGYAAVVPARESLGRQDWRDA